MKSVPRIPPIVLIIIALLLLSTTLYLKQRNVFSVWLYESTESEVNVAEEIANWNNTQITFVTNPEINNVTSCSLYISSTGADLDQVIHGRNIFFNNETGLYMWCENNDEIVIMSPSFDDVDKYFKTFFSSKEVECISNQDCGRYDSDCDYEPDEYMSCISFHCVEPIVECECYVGEDTCRLKTMTENDCSVFYSPKEITYDGTCDAGTCKYPSYNARDTYNCSSYQFFMQKYKYYVFVGLAILIGGIYYYYKRKE